MDKHPIELMASELKGKEVSTIFVIDNSSSIEELRKSILSVSEGKFLFIGKSMFHNNKSTIEEFAKASGAGINYIWYEESNSLSDNDLSEALSMPLPVKLDPVKQNTNRTEKRLKKHKKWNYQNQKQEFDFNGRRRR